MNDDAHWKYNTNSQIKFKNTILKKNLCDYNDASILTKGKIGTTVAGANVAGRQIIERNKQVIFKNGKPFTDCISKINNKQVDKEKIWTLWCQCIIL